MKRFLSVILTAALLITGIIPAFTAAAKTVTDTYLAIESTDPENSTAAFAQQKYDSNGKDPNNEGTFSVFDAKKIGDTAVYNIDVKKGGKYNFAVRYRPHESTGVADIYLNDVKLDKNFPQSGSPNQPATIDYGELEFKEGINTIRFEITGASKDGRFRLNIFKFLLSYDAPNEGQVGENDGIPIGAVGGAIGERGTAAEGGQLYAGTKAVYPDFSSATCTEQTTSGKTFSRFDGTKLDDYVTYIINVPTAGTYDLKVSYRAHETVGKATTYINGKKQESIFKSTGAYNGYYTRSLGLFDLVEGDNYIQFKINEASANGSYKLNILSFQTCEPDNAELNGYTKTFDGASSDKVESYPLWSVYNRSEIFSVKADGVDVPVVAFNSDWYDYAQFSFKKDTPVEIEVTYNTDIKNYSISPLKLGLEGKVEGNKLTFTLEDSQYLIIRLNGSNKRLVITADPPQTDAPASSGEGIFNVTDEKFGADRTGKNSSYAALKGAVAAASEYGSVEGNKPGIVYVPDGVYFSGSLEFYSNVSLYLAPGAVIRASRSEDDFLPKGRKNSLGLPITYLIFTANDTENISVYGRGTVDGNGSYVRSLGFALQTLAPINTSYFTTDGITYRDSGMWSIVPAWSDHLEFLNMKMLNTVKLGEDDGIDICGCQDVVVRHAIGIMWDDPYTTKAYTGYSGEIAGGWSDGTYPGEKNENILFDDCVSWTGCYGFKAGQGFSLDHDGVTFKNGTVYECAVGLGVHFKQGGAQAKNITFDNIDVENIVHQNDDHKTWFVAYIQSTGGGENPVIDGVTVKNINIRANSVSIPKLKGLEKDGIVNLVKNISFENITFKGSTGAATTLYQMGFRAENSENSENCYVINPEGTKTPAEYFASGATVVNDENADTAQAAKTAGNATIHYPNIDFGEQGDKFEIRLATALKEGTLSVHLDSADSQPIGTVALNGDGSYALCGFDIEDISGVHDVYIKTGGAMSIDWFRVISSAADKAAAKAVDELIGKIGEVTLEKKADIGAARAAYDALSDTAKELVTKLSVLEAAEAALKELENPPAPDYTLGDIDGRNGIDVNDLSALKALIMSHKADEEWDEDILKVGDIDFSKDIDVNDLSALKALIMSAK